MRDVTSPASMAAATADSGASSVAGPVSNVEASFPAADTSRAYALSALALLTLVNTLNHLDRQIISILAEPIKNEFGLQDWQVGVLTGLSFALLYGLFGLPAAYLADRTNRVRMLAGCLATWSLFTALAGIATSYAQLVVTRIVVGIAEGGGGGPTQSLTSDLFPRENRARALAILSSGIPLGTFLGAFIGGVVLDLHGWRTGFLVAGLPGLALAAILPFAIKDRRKQTSAQAAARDRIAISDMVRRVVRLAAIPSFRTVTLGGVFITFVNFGQSAFLASHFFRSHGNNLDQLAAGATAAGVSLGAGAILGAALGAAKGVPGVIGTLAGGDITDRLSSRNIQWLATLPALVCWARIPFVIGVCLSPDIHVAIACVVAQAFLTGIGAPSGYSSIQGFVARDNRSLAAAAYLFALNIVGLGLGPLAVGLLSDALQAGGASSATALQWSLLVLGAGGLAVGGLLKWAARRTIAADTIS